MIGGGGTVLALTWSFFLALVDAHNRILEERDQNWRKHAAVSNDIGRELLSTLRKVAGLPPDLDFDEREFVLMKNEKTEVNLGFDPATHEAKMVRVSQQTPWSIAVWDIDYNVEGDKLVIESNGTADFKVEYLVVPKRS
jgi:hypothetical protein